MSNASICSLISYYPAEDDELQSYSDQDKTEAEVYVYCIDE